MTAIKTFDKLLTAMPAAKMEALKNKAVVYVPSKHEVPASVPVKAVKSAPAKASNLISAIDTKGLKASSNAGRDYAALESKSNEASTKWNEIFNASTKSVQMMLSKAWREGYMTFRGASENTASKALTRFRAGGQTATDKAGKEAAKSRAAANKRAVEADAKPKGAVLPAAVVTANEESTGDKPVPTRSADDLAVMEDRRVLNSKAVHELQKAAMLIVNNPPALSAVMLALFMVQEMGRDAQAIADARARVNNLSTKSCKDIITALTPRKKA